MIVGHAAHDFVANGSGCVVFAGGVEIAGQNHGILVIFDIGEKSLHLLPTAGRLAFIFEVRGNNRGFPGWQVGDGNVHDQSHAATVAQFAVDAFFE